MYTYTTIAGDGAIILFNGSVSSNYERLQIAVLHHAGDYKI